MHIMHFCSEYPPQPIFGLGRYVDELTRAQAQESHKVEVFTNSLGGADHEIIHSGVFIRRVHFPPPPKATANSALLLHFNLQLVERCMELYRMSQDAPDVVVAHDWLTFSASYHCARLLNAPLAVLLHDVVFNKVRGRDFGPEDEYIAGIERWACHAASKVIVLSNHVKEELLTRYHAPANKVYVVPGGVGIQPASASESNFIEKWRKTVCSDSEDLILYAGRLDVEKGIPVLLHAIQALSRLKGNSWRLIIAGTGVLNNWVDDFIVEHGLQNRVSRIGYLPFEELRYAYAAADIVVVPSEYEPFGLVSLEAQRMGTPVIVANTGGLAETLEQTKGGLSFKSGDSSELTSALLKLLQDVQQRQKLGIDGQVNVGKHFNWKKIGIQISKVLSDAAPAIEVDTIRLPQIENTRHEQAAIIKESLSDICLFLDGASTIQALPLIRDLLACHAFHHLGGEIRVVQVKMNSTPLERLPQIHRVSIAQAHSEEQLRQIQADVALCIVPSELAESLVTAGIVDPQQVPCLWLGAFQHRCGCGIDILNPHDLNAAVDRLLCDQRTRSRVSEKLCNEIPQVKIKGRTDGRKMVLHIVPQFVTGGAETTLLEIVKGTQSEFLHALISFGRIEGPLPEELLAMSAPILDARPLTPEQILQKIEELRPMLFHIHGCGHVPEWMRLHRRFSKLPIVETEHVVNIGAGMFGPVDKICCVSEATKSAHDRYLFLDGPENRFTTVYNGVNLDDYTNLPSREAAKRAIQLPLDRPIIGRVSALARNKLPREAFKSFVEILKILPRALFVIVGDGEDRERCELEVAKLGLTSSVIFLGERRDIPNVLRAFDVFAYYTEKDALGNVILEAIAAKVPVVTTEVEGTSEALGDAPGCCVSLGNHMEFARAVQEWYSKSRDQAIPIFELPAKFSRQEMAKTYSALYSQLSPQPRQSASKNEAVQRILIKCPTRGRREKFFETFERYQNLLSGRHSIQFVISCDTSDVQMNTPEVIDRLRRYGNTSVYFSNNQSKVEAINADMQHFENRFDILLLASDDMLPEAPGYDDVIAQEMLCYYPRYDGALFFDDGYRGRELNTLVVIGAAYYQRFKYIYNPEYKSLWCDNEFTDVARLLGRAVYVNRILIRHMHPANLGQSYDPLYVLNDTYFQSDKAIYLCRRASNFGISRRVVLSLLVVTLERRKIQLEALLAELKRQIQGGFFDGSVEVLVESDSGESSIGDKRNRLVQRANGEYVCFIDDDDRVSSDYVELLMNSLSDGIPDCVGFSGQLIGPPGTTPKRFVHSLEHSDYSEVNGIYLRPPNHLNPIRREIVIKYPFKKVSKEEDLDFAMRIAKDGVLKAQRYINKDLYFYAPSIFANSILPTAQKKEKVLFVLLFRLGDVICGREIFKRLRAIHKNAYLAWATLPQYSALVPDCADEIIEYGGGQSIFTLQMPHWAKEWDKVYDVQPGWHLDLWRESRLPLVRFIAHLADLTIPKIRLDLPIGNTVLNTVDKRLAGVGDFVVINAGPHVSGPNWAISLREQVSDGLIKAGWTVLALAGPDGVPLAGCINVFDLNYFESAALISRAKLYVGQDCGTSWLACTTNTPKVLLVDRSDKRTGYDSYVDCLENLEIRELPLSSSVEAVLESSLKLLSDSRPKEPPPTLAQALARLVTSRKLRRVIETGTYEGEGTTRSIASAMKSAELPGSKLISIEVNPKFASITRSNIEKRELASFVSVYLGLSIPRRKLPSPDSIENELQQLLKENPDLYVDHEVSNRANHYFHESDFEGKDDLLGHAFKEFSEGPQLVVLDSAGHLGTTEFEYVLELAQTSLLIALDDTRHVKHYRSLQRIRHDSRFRIIAEGDSNFGYCIVEFSPAAVEV